MTTNPDNITRKKTVDSDAYITGKRTITASGWVTSNHQRIFSDAFIDYPKQTIICDGEIVNEILDEFGTNVWVRVITKTFDDEYGDATESHIDYKKKAMVSSYSSIDEEVKSGIFKSGEIVFTFAISDEAYIKTGNRVKYGSDWYEIREVIKQPMQDVLYHLQARVQKI